MKIISVFANNPLFIELQYNSIKKYFKSENPPEIIVFNDAKYWSDLTNFGDITMKKQIIDMCKKLSIHCINIPNEHHKFEIRPSLRHADSVNYITKFMLCNPDIYLMLDCDMFFVDYFDIKEFEKYYFCYVNQERNINGKQINYPWPNFFYLNIEDVPNKELINWGLENGTDTGGKCALWLSKLEKDKILSIKRLQSCYWNNEQIPKCINQNIRIFLDNDIRNKDGKYFAELYYDKIFHYRAASNWMNNSYELHNKLTNLLSYTFSKM
jgi:hypothetical protein